MKDDEHKKTSDAADAPAYDVLRVCVNYRAGDLLPSCGARGSKELAAALQAAQPGLAPDLTIQKVHCLGRCHLGPTLRLSPRGPHLTGVPAEAAEWVLARIAAGEIDALTEAYPDPTGEA